MQTNNTIEHQKIVRYGIGILTIESILMVIWFLIKKPESNVALNILSIALLLLGINLVLGIIAYFIDKKFSVLFFANALLCPLIFYATWIMWFLFYAPYPS